ncbi:tyrosine-type recombinase/integrase [Bdellovibrio bacteriovorus]|uniref:tyrosine-type recombinase/integrase n=1 Tax=Bdellovibrio bacteriovorus TaxID=959 RepID=UPI0035A6BB6A
MSPRLTCHSFRHAFVSILLSKQVSIEEVRQAARHSSATTTAIYSHSLTRSLGIAEKAISEALDSEIEPES